MHQYISGMVEILIDRYSWLAWSGVCVCVAGPRPKVSDTDQGGRMEG